MVAYAVSPRYTHLCTIVNYITLTVHGCTQRFKTVNDINDNELTERLTVHINDDVHRRLREYVETHYGSRHGSLSWVVEEAIKIFLDEKTK